MTPETLTRTLTRACRKVGARPCRHYREVYPKGGRIRVKVRPPAGRTVSGLLDPLGVLWYAKTGEYRTPVQIGACAVAELAKGLGLSAVLVRRLRRSSEKAAESLRARDRPWRKALESAIDELR